MSGRATVPELPALDAFDQEFGRDEAIAHEQRPKTRPRLFTFLALVVTAGVISALAVAWSGGGGPFRFEKGFFTPSQPVASGQSNEQVDHLLRQVEALQQEIRELVEANQEATQTIASLQTDEQASRSSAALLFWHSDLSALSFGIAGPATSEGSASRRPVSVRPQPELRRREGESTPLSLDPSQQ